MGDFRRIPCVIQRAGTSKGVYFHEKDLPENPKSREESYPAVSLEAPISGKLTVWEGALTP